MVLTLDQANHVCLKDEVLALIPPKLHVAGGLHLKQEKQYT